MIAPPIHLFNKTIAVKRLTTTYDSGRSPITTYNAHLSGIAARIQPMSGSESVRYGRDSNRRMWRIFIAPGQDIVEEDQITFTDSTTGTDVTRTLDIQEIQNPQLEGAVLEIVAEETDTEEAN